MAKLGRPRGIKSPEVVRLWFEEYKVHAKANPKHMTLWDYKQSKEVSIRKEIPLSWEGFYVFVYKNYGVANLSDYRYNNNGDSRDYSDFAEIINIIDNEITQEQIDGATAGIYQHNIVALKLGLANKHEITHNGNMDININFDEE